MFFHSLIGWSVWSVVFTLLCAPVAQADDATPGLSADEAVALMLAAHPLILQAETDVRIARGQRSSSALFLNNPSVGGWISLDAERLSLSVQQPVSVTGEGWHARATARHSLQSAELALQRTRRELAAQTRHAWMTASVATSRVAVLEEGAALAERLNYGVQRRFEEGDASQLELRLTRLAQVQVGVGLLESRRAQGVALTSLSGWVLSAVEAQDISTDPLSAAPPSSAVLPDERADVAAARQSLAAARSALSRQRAAVMPPIAIGLGVNVEDGSTFTGPSIGLTLPLFDRNQTGLAAGHGALSVSEANVAMLQATAETELRTARVRVDEASRLGDLLGKDRLDEAKAALESIEAGVLAGEIDLAAAVLLQSQVLNGELAIVGLLGLVGGAQIDLLLATDDDALIRGVE